MYSLEHAMFAVALVQFVDLSRIDASEANGLTDN